MNGREKIEGESELVEKVRVTLDRSVTELDSGAVERLRQARLAAVELAGGKERHWWLAVPRWVTASGVAAFAVLVVAVSLWIAAPRQNQAAGQAEDMEILTAQEHLEIYEDMDFYRWLAAKQNMH